MRLTVVVTRRSAAEELDATLNRLRSQSLADFEVVVIDCAVEGAVDGAVDEAPAPGLDGLNARVLPVPDCRASAAWNAAARSARAPYLLFLDAGLLPEADLLERHLAAHALQERPVAVLGMGPVVQQERLAPVDPAQDGAPVGRETEAPPRALATMLSGRLHGWRCLVLSNVSIATGELLAAGGFDETTCADGLGADQELGWRLAQRGTGVLFEPSAACESADELDLPGWIDRSLAAGIALARVFQVHGDPAIPWFTGGVALDDDVLRRLQGRCESALPALVQVFDVVRSHGWSTLDERERAGTARHLVALSTIATYLGVLRQMQGSDPLQVILEGPAQGALTSIVVLSHDALALTQRCVERLRRCAQDGFPQQLLVVDNGSRDGSREWLLAQPDLEVLVNDDNLGAPVARNQAMASVRGEWVVFMDNDAMVTPGWLAKLRYHAEVDPRAGFVGPVSDRVAHGQAVEGAPSAPEAIDGFAEQLATTRSRKYRLNAMLSSFCILTRRSLLEQLGGFDPRFSPWGFEDDDITLRAWLLGRHGRVALDTFVQHAAYTGPKAERHERLLQRNWSRFAAKWGLSPKTPYRSHGRVHDAAIAQSWSAADLHVALDAPVPGDRAALQALVATGPPRAETPREGRVTARPAASAAPQAVVSLPEATPLELAAELRGQSVPEGLRLSIIVPTYGRPDLVRNLLGHLDAQTLDPAAFEVILVDDGSPEPVRVDPSQHAYHVELLRQENAGPGAARNFALTRCRAPLTLIFNDDAVPAADDLAQHLAAHAARPGHAVLGTFDFVPAVRTPFVQLLDGTSLLFDYVSMQDGALHPWQYFWTCNLSVSTEALRAAGGFDATLFREAIVEDVELGYRLERAGVQVLFHAAARCGHDHVLVGSGYFKRMVRLGVNLLRAYRKHGDPALMWRPAGWTLDERELVAMQLRSERALPLLVQGLAAVAAFEEQHAGEQLDATTLEPVRALARKLGVACMEAGIVLEATGADVLGQAFGRVAARESVTLVVIPDGRADLVHSCLVAATREAAVQGRQGTECLVIHDDSVPGLSAVTVSFDGVRLVRVPPGTSAAAARNAALAQVTTDWVLFIDSAVTLPEGSLARLLHHGRVDPRVAFVGALANRATHGQLLQDCPDGLEGAAGKDAELAREVRGAATYQRLLDGQCLLARRTALQQLHGFDERLLSAGIAAADGALRAHLRGWRNRLALDVLVHRTKTMSRRGTLGWTELARKWDVEGLAEGDWPTLAANVDAGAARPRQVTAEAVGVLA